MKLNTSSVVETLRELERWEKKTSALEDQLTHVRTDKAKLRERLRSLELTLSAVAGLHGTAVESTAQRFDGVR